jgi:hypothetical protein
LKLPDNGSFSFRDGASYTMMAPALDPDEERVMDVGDILKPYYLKAKHQDFVLYLSECFKYYTLSKAAQIRNENQVVSFIIIGSGSSLA